MVLAELITKTCDGDAKYRPVMPVWILASSEYGILEIAELIEGIRLTRN